MANEIDVLTPVDREGGNPVRLPFTRAGGTAVAVWSRADGRPSWRPPAAFSRVARPSPDPSAPGAGAYAAADYFAGDYVR